MYLPFDIELVPTYNRTMLNYKPYNVRLQIIWCEVHDVSVYSLYYKLVYVSRSTW